MSGPELLAYAVAAGAAVGGLFAVLSWLLPAVPRDE